MKNSIKFIVLVCMSFSIWACTNEDIVVRYPASTPKIDSALVTESQITYGDSIHIKIAVSDKVAPLSTLLLKVVVNNEVVTSETIRTKGKSSSIKRTYRVPFVANRPDNAAVKIYLTETNVSGITRDSIVSTTIAKRPVLTNLYIVPDFGQGATAKMTLVNADSLIYKVTGLIYTNSINFKIATKVNKFKRIDWSGLVFGLIDATNGTIGLVDSLGLSINGTDGRLVGISEITFDALQFTTKVGGKLLEPVTTLDITSDLPLNPPALINNTGFRGGNVYFGQGVEVTFTGITNLANNLSPDYFQVTGANTAKFVAKTGLYKAYYLTAAGYLYIEPQPEAIYPDVIWICGNGFGRPSSPYTTTSSWNWNSPLDYAPCCPIAAGIYQVTVYAKNDLGTDGFGTFNFKFFDQRGWTGTEETSTNFTISLPLVSRTDVNNVGNVSGSPTPFEGVYRITLNKNDKTIKAEKLN
jgi:hypothetical protein